MSAWKTKCRRKSLNKIDEHGRHRRNRGDGAFLRAKGSVAQEEPTGNRIMNESQIRSDFFKTLSTNTYFRYNRLRGELNARR
jgi:hypothetical protein